MGTVVVDVAGDVAVVEEAAVVEVEGRRERTMEATCRRLTFHRLRSNSECDQAQGFAFIHALTS